MDGRLSQDGRRLSSQLLGRIGDVFDCMSTVVKINTNADLDPLFVTYK
jgi:hypothetical protein